MGDPQPVPICGSSELAAVVNTEMTKGEESDEISWVTIRHARDVGVVPHPTPASFATRATSLSNITTWRRNQSGTRSFA